MDFSSICRTCMSKESLLPIFKRNVNYAIAINAIFLGCGIKVDPSDKLPQNMCSSCLLRINEILKFRNKCKSVEEQLLKIKSVPAFMYYDYGVKKDLDASKNDSTDVNEDTFLQVKIESDDTTSIKDGPDVTDNEIDDQPLKYLVSEPKESLNDFDTKSDDNEDGEEAEDTEILHSEEFNNDSDFVTITNKTSNILDIVKIESIDENEENTQEMPTTEKITITKKGPVKKNIRTGKKHAKNVEKAKKVAIVNKLEDCTKNSEFKNTGNSENKNENFIEPNSNSTEHEKELPYAVMEENGRNTKVECKICWQMLSVRSIDMHMQRKHPGQDGKVKCELCDGYFAKIKLKRHLKLMHGNEAFICRYCKIDYKSKEELLDHHPSCTARKKKRSKNIKHEMAECDICHLKMQKQSLRLHNKLIHDGLKPVCEHCGKAFGNKYRLLEHYRAKHGYPKHQCSFCDFQSASVMGLKNHERRHRGEKPFICETCGAKFHAAYLLSQHKHSHSTQKTVKCDLCPSSFKTTNCLNVHKKTCHSSALYSCSICLRTYKCQYYVIKHIRRVHNIVDMPSLTQLVVDPDTETGI